MKIVIGGHIDHGKSTLLGRLMLETSSLAPEKLKKVKQACKNQGKDAEIAFLVDQLKEEQKNNITIDTTQVFLTIKEKQYVFIDTPGHVEFIKNMLSGLTQAEAALVIIDVNEGLKEQTKRFISILKMLGITQVLAVFNKMDEVKYSRDVFLKRKKELIDFSGLRPVCVPVSAKYGANVGSKHRAMFWYKAPTLIEAMQKFQEIATYLKSPLRLPVQDVYTHLEHPVAVGRVACGSLKLGQKYAVLPQDKLSSIRSITSFEQERLKVVEEGENVGINLDADLEIIRGDIISELKRKPYIKNTFKALLFWLSKKPAVNAQELDCRCSVQFSAARIKKIVRHIDSQDLKPIKNIKDEIPQHQMAEVEITLDKKIVIEKFAESFGTKELGRFMLEEKGVTAAMGIVL